MKEKRFEYILKSLKTKKEVTFEELAQELEVSDDTIRRDIEQLHKNGLLSKVRGGAIPRAKNPASFQERTAHLKKEKDIIGRKTQQLIENKMTVFMDGGTTVCSVAQYFPTDIRIRVVTNNYTLIPILSAYPNVDLVVAGGNYDRNLQSFYGAAACETIAGFTADLYLMGICGVDSQFGVSAAMQQDADVKRAMKKASRQAAVLATHERLRTVEPFKVCEIQDINFLITDLNSDDEDLDAFRNLDITIL